VYFFFFSSRRRHTRSDRDWSSDVCSSDLTAGGVTVTDRVIGPRPVLGAQQPVGVIAKDRRSDGVHHVRQAVQGVVLQRDVRADEIGRASCRERGESGVVGGGWKKRREVTN